MPILTSPATKGFPLGAVALNGSCCRLSLPIGRPILPPSNWWMMFVSSGRPPKKPLHFRDLRHEHRLPLIDRIAKANLRVITVLVHKPTLSEPENFRNATGSISTPRAT